MCRGRSTVARGTDLNVSSTDCMASATMPAHVGAVGKCDGKSVIPTDTKFNVNLSVEITTE